MGTTILCEVPKKHSCYEEGLPVYSNTGRPQGANCRIKVDPETFEWLD